MDAPPVQYVRTSDGFNIAYAVTGEGLPLVHMPVNFSHIEAYWTDDTYVRDLYRRLAAEFRFIQYDGRGQGMSTRGLSPAHSLRDDLADLELLVDHLGLDTFVLFSRSHASIHYCLKHPERVQALVLGLMTIYRTSFPTTWLGGLPTQDWDLFLHSSAALNRRGDINDGIARLIGTIDQDDWLARMRAYAESDIVELLPEIKTPTLVFGTRRQRFPAPRESQELAARIPNSRFVLVDGAFDLVNAEETVSAIQNFLASLPYMQARDGATVEKAATLSPRETEVMRLVAQGKSNQQIADELVVSIWTVTNHLKHILNKIGAANRTEAANYAHRHRLI